MFGTFALVAGVVFLVLAIARLRAASPRALAAGVPLAAGLAAVFALLHWHGTGDSRWLVGAVLLGGAAGLTVLQNNPGADRRNVAIAAIILGLLGTALFGIATAKPMRAPAATVTTA